MFSSIDLECYLEISKVLAENTVLRFVDPEFPPIIDHYYLIDKTQEERDLLLYTTTWKRIDLGKSLDSDDH